MSETFRFREFDIPIDLMMMTGGGPDTFETISDGHFRSLNRHVGILPHHNILEIGCGIGRDAIPLSTYLKEGHYTGVDIIKPSIDWCSSNLVKRNKKFRFVHFDVKDELHNPSGQIDTTDIKLPVADLSIDRIFLFSVFTHMFEMGIVHYLKEFRRILKPDGLIYATTFLYDDAVLEAARKTNLTRWNLRFEHEVGKGCRINNPEAPLGAVAYDMRRWDRMILAAGLKHAKPLVRGHWSGIAPKSDDGQDVIILAKEKQGAMHFMRRIWSLTQ